MTTDGYPHLAEACRKTVPHNSKAWVAPAWMTDRRKFLRQAEGKNTGERTEKKQKKKIMLSQRRSLTILERFSQRRQRETRIDDQPAMPDDPNDHAATRGRDVSLRSEDGHREWHSGVGDHRYSGGSRRVSRNLPQGDSGEKQRRKPQPKRSGDNKGKRTARSTSTIWRIITKN